MQDNNKPNYKICGITTRALTMRSFMIDNLAYMTEHNFSSYIVCENSEEIHGIEKGSVTYFPIEMNHGNVSISEVIRCTKTLYKLFKNEKFDIIQYASCNAGLYASIAGVLAHVPTRIFCQWGLTYLGFSGIKRWFYKMAEKFTCLLSTSVQPDSPSNMNFAISEGLFSPQKGTVIWNGSACGIDLCKYDISHKDEWRKEIRNQYNIPSDCKVFGFVGRVVRDKGINELLEAFEGLNHNSIRLMIVGPRDDLSDVDAKLYEKSLNDKRIIYTDAVMNTAKFYAAFDYLVLPSYREGFGMVLLEAAALGVPSIISNITGPTDLIKDGFNGFICDVKSSNELLQTMRRAISIEDSLYKAISCNAYTEAKMKYDKEKYKAKFLENRRSLLKNKKSTREGNV